MQDEKIENHGAEAVASLNARRLDEAEPLFLQVLARDPDNSLAHQGLGLIAMRRDDMATARIHFVRALELRPDDLSAQVNLADVLQRMGRLDEVRPMLERMRTANPGFAPVLFMLGKVLWDQGEHVSACQHFEAAGSFEPALQPLFEVWVFDKLRCADWRGHDVWTAFFNERVRAGRSFSQPLLQMMFSGSPADLAQCARTHATWRYPAKPPLAPRPAWNNARIRIGFITGELYDHPVAHLLAGVLEHFDRTAFELIAFSLIKPPRHEITDRILPLFDEVVDVGALDNKAAARAIVERQVDIAITLSGYTNDCRPGILAWRPAPVQVNYQGFPGTMGAPYIDYLIADRYVIPEHEAGFYSEQVVWMPDSYQPTDDAAQIADLPRSRAVAGLPATGFVFMAYNKAYKITPARFAAWMRILTRVDGSVLWLADANPMTQANLRREAQAQGVDPARLVFAPITASRAEHVARHVLADLFLDTGPYSAHSTASDALWAGLPLLTCRGTTFPGRVCAGLLTVGGMADMVCEDLADYEEKAVALAGDPARLGAIRARVAAARQSPLFDTARYTRHLEAALRTMHETRLAGLAPRAFAVSPV